MARVAGIQIEKDSKGRPAYVRINIKKHPEFIPQLEKVGAIPQDEFEKEWNNGITGSELVKRIHARIDKWPERCK